MQTSVSGTVAPAAVTHVDALIIGAGIAGLYQLYRLRELGLQVKVVEAGDNVGGTWYWNRYPGARVDSPSHVYQYWFSKELSDEWNWSERFPAQPEIERYLNFVADRFELRNEIQFATRVTAASYDEVAMRWTVTTDQRTTFHAQYLISCTGMLSAPLIPKFAGQDQYRGRIFHTTQWPVDLDCTGKRVGVIGTGASGIQVIQTIAGDVAQLTVFQREPQYAIPMKNPRLTDSDRAAHKKHFHQLRHRVMHTFSGYDFDLMHGRWADLSPHERRADLEDAWADGTLAFWAGLFPELFVDPQINAEISEFVRDKIRQRINNPALADKLIPTTYGFGTKRVPLEDRYFDVYNRGNVELVCVDETPIERLTEHGVQTSDGAVRELDVLVLATGFDASTGALTRIDIRGRGGRSLKDDWSSEVSTTLGLQIHGYPNLFTTGAPLAPAAGLCNMTTCLQQQVDWIAGCIAFLRAHGLNEIEPTRQTQDEWVEYHDRIANASLVSKTNSWYTGANVPGKRRRLLSFAGGVGTYQQKCDELAIRGYPGFAMR